MTSLFSTILLYIYSFSKAYGLIEVKVIFSSFILTMIYKTRSQASLSTWEAQEKMNCLSAKSSLSEYCQMLNDESSLSSYFSRTWSRVRQSELSWGWKSEVELEGIRFIPDSTLMRSLRLNDLIFLSPRSILMIILPLLNLILNQRKWNISLLFVFSTVFSMYPSMNRKVLVHVSKLSSWNSLEAIFSVNCRSISLFSLAWNWLGLFSCRF